MAPRLPPALAERFGDVHPLGQGAYGRVLKARDRTTGAAVAIKLLHPRVYQDPGMMKRFQREAELSARIASPHVARVHDFGTDKGRPYLVMDFVEGIDLEKYLARCGGKLPLDEAAAIYLDILAGIAAAHAEDVLHRDLKPDNILLGPDGAVLTDFGLSREFESHSLTMAGEMVGTATHMTPQQLTGAEADASSDLYAATLIFVEAVTGAEVFPAPNFLRLREAKRRGLTRGLLAQGYPVSARLDEAVTRALSGTAESRPRDAGAFLEEVRVALNRPVGGGHRRAMPSAGRILAVGVGLGAGVALVLGTLAWWFYSP